MHRGRNGDAATQGLVPIERFGSNRFGPVVLPGSETAIPASPTPAETSLQGVVIGFSKQGDRPIRSGCRDQSEGSEHEVVLKGGGEG